MADLVIVGTGGTSLDILDAVLERARDGDDALRPVCFLDDNVGQIGRTFAGFPVRGPLEAARDMTGCFFINGIGSPGNFWRRDQIVARLGVEESQFATIVHPTASVSTLATIGAGTAILQHVTVSASARIGAHVVILPNSVISHDCSVGDFSCITGGVCLSGGVSVAPLCYVGSNASVRGGVSLGRASLVGMGSVVLHDVPEKTVVIGNPARILRPTMEGSPRR